VTGGVVPRSAARQGSATRPDAGRAADAGAACTRNGPARSAGSGIGPGDARDRRGVRAFERRSGEWPTSTRASHRRPRRWTPRWRPT